MSAASRKSAPKTCADSASAISSPASEAGASPFDSQAFPMMSLGGLALAHASHSALPGLEEDSTTSGTSGRPSTPSSASLLLQSSLASRLRARMPFSGLILYRVIWKTRATPLGRRICAARGSALQTSASASTGWATPAARDYRSPNLKTYQERGGEANGEQLNNQVFHLVGWPTPCQQDGPNGGPNQGIDRLPGAASMAGWPTPGASDDRATSGGRGREKNPSLWVAAGWSTPTAQDHSRGVKPPRPTDTGVPLSQQAGLAGWPSPKASNTTGPGIRGEGGANLQTVVMLCPDSSKTSSGSPAETASSGQLNPSHSRWLMGFPKVWDEFAPTSSKNLKKKS